MCKHFLYKDRVARFYLLLFRLSNPSGLINMVQHFRILLRVLRRYLYRKFESFTSQCPWHRGVKYVFSQKKLLKLDFFASSKKECYLIYIFYLIIIYKSYTRGHAKCYLTSCCRIQLRGVRMLQKFPHSPSNIFRNQTLQ